ncbi:uncharacterized protein N7511_010364 [Penicillium nucicola]|uniref:uncharacterized protein n=1 Tax=Penicillium nucicola TaxID=1850975 RepID=UPI0025458F6E|nr:uncharacterized protein N7511_010364 [Penicillium nucicola]KAJ5748668.1 hypothetical protein N7511_010364 [Penicillium nucicola]
MSFLSALCGCFSREEKTPSPPETMIQRPNNNIQTGHFTLNGDGQFIRPSPSSSSGHSGHGPPDDSADGYSSVVPLPQYTARPMSLHEKTLEAHMRDPSVSSESQEYPVEEKNRNLYDEEVTSDASSAISYPSSYGNTSTATRETPPPPYSPRHSVMLSRSRSISVSSAMAVIVNPPPIARLNGSRTGPVYVEDDDRSIRRHRRVSWESR